MRSPSFELNIPDVLVGKGATGIIATKSRPTIDEVLRGVELLNGTIGIDIHIADLRRSREFLESRDFTFEEATTTITTTHCNYYQIPKDGIGFRAQEATLSLEK